MRTPKLQQSRTSATCMLTVPEVAERLNLSEKTIWNWIYSNRLTVVRMFRSVRIPSDQLEAFIEDSTIPAGKAS